jgi:hypothetical protein
MLFPEGIFNTVSASPHRQYRRLGTFSQRLSPDILQSPASTALSQHRSPEIFNCSLLIANCSLVSACLSSRLDADGLGGGGLGGVSQTCESLSQTCEALSQTCEALSQTCEALSQTCEALSQTCEALSQTCESLSQTCESQTRKRDKTAKTGTGGARDAGLGMVSSFLPLA